MNNVDNVDTLTKHQARFVYEAIRDHPEGPVKMITTRHATEITYQVVIGERVIWDRAVSFGKHERNVTGGADFVAAARIQDAVAFAAYALLTED